MKLVDVLRYIGGYVAFSAEGGFPERFINLCAQDKIAIWDTRRDGIMLYACCMARDYARLRRVAHRSGVRMRLKRRVGLPFFSRRYRLRPGLIAGVAIYILLLQYLSHYIWVVDVSGNENVPTTDILSAVETFHVAPGQRTSELDVADIQLKSLKQLPDLAWITVNMEGSVAHVQVTERKEPAEDRLPKTPANIKAGSDGIILSMEVYEGDALVKCGDAVAEGMLLVSGVRTTALGDYLTRANAKIMAQTTRVLQVTVPLAEEIWQPSNRVMVRPTWHVFGLDIPWYNSGEIAGHYIMRTEKHMLTAGDLELPIGVSHTYYTEQVQTTAAYTEQQAEQIAWERLMQQETDLTQTAEILSRHEISERVGDAWQITVTYECVENIAVYEEIAVE